MTDHIRNVKGEVKLPTYFFGGHLPLWPGRCAKGGIMLNFFCVIFGGTVLVKRPTPLSETKTVAVHVEPKKLNRAFAITIYRARVRNLHLTVF